MDNISEFPNMNAIKDEAAAWVVKLHGYTYKNSQGIPPSEIEALEQWLDKSKLHRESFLKTLGSWEAMGMLEELADFLPLATRTPDRRERYASVKATLAKVLKLQNNFSYAVSGVFAAACVLMVVVVLNQTPQGLYRTGIGEQASYKLEDGSVITLNTNTEVQVDYSDKQRVINLQYGEAHFDVAKNKARPFLVYAGEGMVWAVGTAFNIYSQNGLVDVTVSEGTVKVFSGLAQREPVAPVISEVIEPVDRFRDVVLDAGEAVTYAERVVSKAPLQKEMIEKRLAWQEGALIFEGETLAEAIKQISRYTDRQLVVIDPAISNIRVGGRFKTDDIDELLTSLARGLDLAIEKIDNDKIVFTTNTKNN